MRSPLEVSTMGVMFSAHGDSVRPILPPRTFSVGFEEEIVPGVMFFTFTDPKIVVKSLFPILYFKKKQKSPFFRASAEFTERRREKMGTFVF